MPDRLTHRLRTPCGRMRDKHSALRHNLGRLALDTLIGRVRIHSALGRPYAYNLLNLRLIGRLILPLKLVVPFRACGLWDQVTHVCAILRFL